ncbi:MAG: peptidylprolyl isomerase [Aquificaceae bacterium]|nr:peptidylprolyl isomerase [Aquificaceae bacterium]MDW8422894.1 peptidylprolyl isomerase [Aquificaceae bacterium]
MVSRGIKEVLCGVLLWTALSFASLVDRVVASVNSEPILESDVKMGMLFYETTDRKLVVEKLIEDMLLYQFLLGRGLQVPQELIDEALQNIARANRTSLESIAEELAKENLTLRDLRRFLEREILATQGLRALLEREVRVSDAEVELEMLKRGNVRVLRNIELLVVEKKDWDKLKRVFDPQKSLEEIAKAMGVKVERLKVGKGELIEVLDREVWKSGLGELVFAEDRDSVYIAKVISQEEVKEDKSKEELRQELLSKKVEQRRAELLERLRKNSFIKVIQ